MTNLVEVVFENVAKNHVIDLLSSLISGSEKTLEYHCSEDITVLKGNEISDKGVEDFFNFEGDVTALMNIRAVAFGDLILPSIQLRLLKYCNQYDIDFNFDPNEIENIGMMTLIKQLHAHVVEIAVNCNVATFFGGMEPASDEDTRYFTNTELGPLAA